MERKIIEVDFIDGVIQVPEHIKKILRNARNKPINYTRECPKLTPKQLSEFVRYEDFRKNRDLLKKEEKTQEKTTEAPKKRSHR